MKKCNFSTVEYFNKIAENIEPKYAFKGKTKEYFRQWKEQLINELKKLIGPYPKSVTLNPEIVWEIHENNLIKRKIVFDLEEFMSVTALLCFPDTASSSNLVPAILCDHGHGRFGKDSVMGVTSSNDPRRQEEITCYNMDFGLQMAQRGYATLAIDWRGFGERSDNADPYMGDDGYPYPGRTRCNVHFLRGVLMGINLLALNIFDAARCVDYLESLDFVDSDRIGTMGISLGGTIATWHSFLDNRIKATDIICYSCCFKTFAVEDAKLCGSQIIPGLYQLCDVAELQGLIAPKPLLCEIGLRDLTFQNHEALECSRKVQRIYEAAGVYQNYQTDIFDGAHEFAANKAFNFFDNYLKH